MVHVNHKIIVENLINKINNVLKNIQKILIIQQNYIKIIIHNINDKIQEKFIEIKMVSLTIDMSYHIINTYSINLNVI